MNKLKFPVIAIDEEDNILHGKIFKFCYLIIIKKLHLLLHAVPYMRILCYEIEHMHFNIYVYALAIRIRAF